MRKFLKKVVIVCASVIIMVMAAGLIVVVHGAKFIRKYVFRGSSHSPHYRPQESSETAKV